MARTLRECSGISQKKQSKPQNREPDHFLGNEERDRNQHKMAKREPKLLRISVAAHELGLHPITVRRWIKAGRIQAVPMGREVRVPRAEVERLVGKVDGRL